MPIDYTMDSHLALGLALELRETHGSALRLFHAVEGEPSDEWLGGIGSPSVGGNWVSESQGRLRRFLENVVPVRASEIDICARLGPLVETVREEMRAWNATLLVAAASVHRTLFRSPAEQLVRDIDIPVLIVPAKPQT